MKILQLKFLSLAVILTLVAGCDKKESEEMAPPLDASSGAPLVELGCGSFRTFTQAQWDLAPTANPSPGTYCERHFEPIFFNASVNGLVVGVVKEPAYAYVRFTTAESVRNFLPQTGAPIPLTDSGEDPLAGSFNSALAGEVVALKLNIYYDDYERSRTRRRSGTILSHLIVTKGPFQGLDVSRLLTIGERVLGRDPARTTTYPLFAGGTKTFSYTAEQVHQAIEQVNQNFAGGTVNQGFLTCR